MNLKRLNPNQQIHKKEDEKTVIAFRWDIG